MPAGDKVLRDLINSIDQLQSEVGELRTSETQRIKAENNRKNAFRWVVGGIIVALIVGVIGIWSGQEAQSTANAVDEALNQLRIERTERSIIQCRQENAGLRQGMQDVSKFIEVSIINRDGSISENNQNLINLLNDRFKFRDCTAAGVEKYLSELPTN